jgi:hypothetical protein
MGCREDLLIPAHLRIRLFLYNFSYFTSNYRLFRKNNKRLILYYMINRNALFTSIETVRRIKFNSFYSGNKLL